MLTFPMTVFRVQRSWQCHKKTDFCEIACEFSMAAQQNGTNLVAYKYHESIIFRLWVKSPDKLGWVHCLSRGSQEESTSRLESIIARMHVLVAVEQRSLFPCWLSAKVHSLLITSIWFSSHGVPSILKAVTLPFLLTPGTISLPSSSASFFCHSRRKLSSFKGSCV